MMQKQLIILAMFVTAFHLGIAQTPSHTPKAGCVPNAETAVKVAEAALIPVYGEKHILSERPFKATLDGDVWTVNGTVVCDEPGQCVGGAAQVKISKTTGQILFMIHYK
jgi:hypothetical protein